MNFAQKSLSNVSDFSSEVIPRLIGQIYTYETTAPFIDVGTPEAYSQANELVSI